MMTPISLKQKNLVAAFVETMEVEAGRSRNIEIDSHSYDAALRPYTLQKPVYDNIVLVTLAPFFTKHLAQAASEALQISEAYMSAALILKHQYHETLRQNNSDLCKISDKIFTLTDKVVYIDRMRKQEATNYAFCGVFGVVGSALLSLGLYKKIQWMKTAGKVALFATALLYGYTWLLHRTEQKKVPQIYSEIGHLAEKIRYDLWFYTDDMKFQLPAERNYQPLIQEFVVVDYQPAPPDRVPDVEHQLPAE